MAGPHPRALWCVTSIISGSIALFFIASLTATVVVDFSFFGVVFSTGFSLASSYCAWSDARHAWIRERVAARPLHAARWS